MKRGPKGDPNPQKGPLGDPGPLKETQLGTVGGNDKRWPSFIITFFLTFFHGATRSNGRKSTRAQYFERFIVERLEI